MLPNLQEGAAFLSHVLETGRKDPMPPFHRRLRTPLRVLPLALLGILPSPCPCQVTPTPLRIRGMEAPPPPPVPLADGSAATAALRAQVFRLAQEGILSGSAEKKRERFRSAEGGARTLLARDPQDPENLYAFAAATGLRLDYVGTWEKVRLGEEIFRVTGRLLDLDPNHAGGHQIMGRLHAGVMRIRPLTRFVAHRILGSQALGKASWESAEFHLRRAGDLEPRVLGHQLELAILFMSQGRHDRAMEALDGALSLPDLLAIDPLYRERAKELRAALLAGRPPKNPSSLVSGPLEVRAEAPSRLPGNGPSGR